MNWNLLITAFIAITGWFAAHRLAAGRDRANKRREIRLDYLLKAYRTLESASNRPIASSTVPGFESSAADIRLFGSARQAALAKEFSLAMAAEGTAALDDLMSDLRNDLRSELELEAIDGPITYLRIKPNK